MGSLLATYPVYKLLVFTISLPSYYSVVILSKNANQWGEKKGVYMTNAASLVHKLVKLLV